MLLKLDSKLNCFASTVKFDIHCLRLKHMHVSFNQYIWTNKEQHLKRHCSHILEHESVFWMPLLHYIFTEKKLFVSIFSINNFQNILCIVTLLINQWETWKQYEL